MRTDGLYRVTPCMPIVVSGFTPIDRPQALTNRNGGTESKVRSSSKTTPRGNIPASNNPEVNTKKRKSPTSSRSVISKKAKSSSMKGSSKEKDISKDLARIKPGLKSQVVHSDDKSGNASDVGFLEATEKGLKSATSFDVPLIEDDDDTSSTLVADTESRSFSLAERYQAEYGLTNTKDTVNLTSTKSQQKSSDKIILQVSTGTGLSLRPANHDIGQRSTTGQASLFWHSDSPHDFQPPPSAQLPRVSFEDALNPATFASNAHSVRSTLLEEFHNFEIEGAFDSDIDGLLTNEPYSDKVGPEFTENAVTDGKSLHEVDEWPDIMSIPDGITIYDDEEVREIPGMMSPGTSLENRHASGALHPVSGNINKAVRPRNNPCRGAEDEFDDVDLESSFVELESPATPRQVSSLQTSPVAPSSSPKLKWLPPKSFTPNKVLAKFLSKVPEISQDVPHLVPKNAAGGHQPFVRPPFPKAVRDRSPILGLTSTTVLRTCFRIGEAINAASQTSRSNINAVVELYTRVIASSREANGGYKQMFQFADLFTDKPPYLSGTSTIWKGVGLWDQDSRVFVGEAAKGKMCRVVGRVKKGESAQGGCAMTVLSIWEVDWEDIGIAKGVVCS